MIEKKLQNLICSTNATEYKPQFFRLANSTDKISLEKLLEDNPDIFVYDEMQGQLEELLKLRTPDKNFSKSELEQVAKNYIGATPMVEYGVWVYYPWSKQLVHLLDENEFVEVRTNRNQHRITPDEEEILAKKKVGVIGLSVGQSVAITMVQERIIGELRIADYDILELSNYNRIRTKLSNLGVRKTISVAREIAELDPYIKVECFDEGITEDNIDDFLLKGGKLDILIDECDGLDVKILSRVRAKELQIPVVMESSDRGTLDVERFDLEKDRPILHGFLEHLDITKVKTLKTNQDKIPYMLAIMGKHTISKRAKASLIEVGHSITTWPQLASAVTLGGGLTTDVCRRILLKEFNDSGRYFVDLEEIVGGKKEVDAVRELQFTPLIDDKGLLNLIKDSGIKYDEHQLDLTKDEVSQLIDAAIIAPSGANAQPWRFVYTNKTLFLFFDTIYKAQLLDINGMTSFIGLGAASENLILKAHALGLEVEMSEFPNKNSTSLVASFKFYSKGHASNKYQSHQFDYLEKLMTVRETNRRVTPRQVISDDIKNNLVKVAETIPGAKLSFVDSEEHLKALGDIMGSLDRIRILHEGGFLDFLAEIRWNEQEATFTRNGIDLNLVDLTESEKAGFEMAKDWKAIELLNKWYKGKGLEQFSRKSAVSASAIGFITMPEYSPLDFFKGGRALERVWLEATNNKIAFHPISIPTLLFNTFMKSSHVQFPDAMKAELHTLREKFVNVFSIKEGIGEVVVFRIFHAKPYEVRSLRVPTEQVLNYWGGTI